MKDNYQLLIEKLDAFIRKYYKNQLIRGTIYVVALALAFYLVVIALESIGHFNTGFRTALFYSFVAGNLLILGRFIIIPLVHLYRIGKIISHEQAASIIGSHFSEVKDKLLNVLQLKMSAGTSISDTGFELVAASINQKAEELKPVTFSAAINFGDNRKFVRFALIPLMVLVVLFFTAPSLIKDSTKRLIEHGTYFEKPAPFVFEVLNKDLKTVQQQDYQLDVRLKGDEVPQEAYVEIDHNQFKLDKENMVSFHHVFRNVQKNISFRLFADGFYSKEYLLEAMPNPLLMNFEISLEYPGYLKRPNEKMLNTGDLVIPAGTRVNWKFNTQNTDVLKLGFADSIVALKKSGDNTFVFSKRFSKNDSYSVSTSNSFLKSKDSIRYSVSVIPDLYPSIAVEQQTDSFSTHRTFFKGLVKDDYGFSKLTFNYRYLKSNGDDSTESKKGKQFAEVMGVNKNATQDQFFYNWDVSNINVAAGDEIEYYFEVTDNDGLTGGKSTRSQSQVFKAPSLKEIAESTSKNNESIKNDLKESIANAKQLQKDVSELSKKLLDKKEMSWEDKKKAEDLLKREKDLERRLEDVKNKNLQNNEKKSEYKPVDQEMLDKQQQLEALMDKLMTPEMKKMMEELQRLMEQLDKNKLQEQLSQMKFDNKDMQKELERALELFKQMEVEQKLQDNIDKLNDLAKKEDELSKKSEDKNADSKDLKEQQENLSKEFEDFKKDMKDLEDKNQALETPNEMEKTEEEQKDIQNDMKSSEDQLEQNKNSKASKSQKSASQKMDKLAQKLSKMQSDMAQEQAEEDMNALRALLENLLHLSFDQENLMQDLKTMDISNPQYLKIGQQQRKLKDDAKMIEDSLFALSKRVIQIQSKVNQEIADVNKNMDAALDNLEDRLVPQARSRQQFVMTSVNDLALLLSEALNQMQQQQNQASKPGSCTKPGKGKPKSVGDLRKMQEELNKNMQKMKDAMKPGNKPGKQGQGQQGMSEQLAKMAAQQEYIRNELQKLNMQENKDGKNTLGDLANTAKKMEETENDIVNRMISDQTLKRQQDILTRLLESERAERERDQDEQRKSEEAKNNAHRNPAEFEEYKRLKLKEMELLRTVPPSLNSYYKKKVNDYFQTLEK